MHLAAFVGATSARLGATFAAFVALLFAFGRAGIADFCAKSAESVVETRSAAHECSCHPADVRAIDAEPRAFFSAAQTAVCATFALLRAAEARVDAALMFVMCHVSFPPFVYRARDRR